MKKTKKLLLAVLSVMTAGVCALGVAGCDLSEILGGLTGGDKQSESSSKKDTDTEQDSEDEHEHSYDQEIADEEYLKAEATCTQKAVYYKSCECGKAGKKTFEYGELASHDLDDNGLCAVCDENASAGLEYNLATDGTFYYLVGRGECTDTDIVIPKNYQGLPVKKIKTNSFAQCQDLTSVTIPDSITDVGMSAFSSCSTLTSVAIQNGVISIEGSAFYGCTSLTNIEIPDSVTSVGDNAFYDTVYYNNENNWEDGALYLDGWLIKVNAAIEGEYTIKEGTKGIAGYAFSGCTNLTGLTMPDDLIVIGDNAFSNCTRLTDIVIPESVTHIGLRAFHNCRSLTEVRMSDGVERIGDYAFYSCKALADITIPESVKSIGKNAFEDTAYYNNSDNWEKGTHSPLTNIKPEGEEDEVGDSVLYLDGWLLKANPYFTCGEYTVKADTVGLADEAFYDCGDLSGVTIGDGVKCIPTGAFKSCDDLYEVALGTNVERIGQSAFYECDSLNYITISENVSVIEAYAFYECDLRHLVFENATNWHYLYDYEVYPTTERGKPIENITAYFLARQGAHYWIYKK